MNSRFLPPQELTIEWIYDAYGEDQNPLGSDAGTAELTELCQIHGVRIESVCADWFMDFPLNPVTAEVARNRWQRLAWLMDRCAHLPINRIVLPFVDASAMRSQRDVDDVVAGCKALLGLIDATNV